jgi:xylulokinase
MMDVFLGLDLGTTNIKVLAVDLDGQPVASLSIPTPARVPQLASAPEVNAPEYDADGLWQACAPLIRQLVEKLPSGSHIAGLAVASMGESGVLIDDAGAPLAPIFTWYDHRTVPWMEWWHQRVSDDDLYRITGLPLDHIYSACKIQWLRENYPAAFSRGRTWLSLADWITFRLTGQLSTSYSQASRSMLFDLRSRTWSKDLLKIMDLQQSILPPPMPSGEIVGRVNHTAAQETGLPPGTPVATGGHDHICAALAAGAVTSERILDSAGTAEAILVTLDAPVFRPEIAATGLCCGCHTVRDRYYLLGGFIAGGALAWVSRILAGEDTPAAISNLMEQAASSPLGANGAWFLPYLDGSGPPERDPRAWGAWLGLRLHHSRGDLARAAVEGVSYAIRFLLENILKTAVVEGGEIRCVGGGTHNHFWQQVKADVLGMPIDTPRVTDMTAQGAALIAALGLGAFADETEVSRLAYRSSIRYEVQPEAATRYLASYQQEFLKLYPLFKQLQLP